MKKILLILTALVMSQIAMAQQFSLPIMPEKMWPSDYAKYETDVLNCCNYLLTADPAFNQPKHEECTSFLIRWLSGSPQVRVALSSDLVDANNGETIEVPVVWNEVNEKMFKGDTNDVINVTGVIKQGEENFVARQPHFHRVRQSVGDLAGRQGGNRIP